MKKKGLPEYLLDDIVLNFMEYGTQEPIGPVLQRNETGKARSLSYLDSIDEAVLREKARLGITIQQVRERNAKGTTQTLPKQHFGSIDSLLKRWREAREAQRKN